MSASPDCCRLPPVEVNYSPKGDFTQVAGYKAYASGPEDSKKVLVFVYDIFGYSPQIQQGADLLASQGYRVVMPDILEGNYATADMFSGTDEGNAKKDKYFADFPGVFVKYGGALAKVVDELKKDDVTIGTIGACLGYAIIVKSADLSKVSAIAGIHPSFAAPEDSEKINVPLALLPSSGEDKDVMNKIHEAVEKKNQGKNVIKFFPDSPHGWMAARGELEKDDGRKNFADGYKILAEFFKNTL